MSTNRCEYLTILWMMIWILRLISLYIIVSVDAAQEGRKFLLAFPPDHALGTAGLCQIVFNANQLTKVNITFIDHSDHITVDTQSYIYSKECTIRPTPGHSNKAFIVTSDVDISVQVFTDRNSVGDAYLALPSLDHGAEYILATTPKPYVYYEVNSVFMVVSEHENTEVEVFAPASGGYDLVETITLNSYSTYVNNSAKVTGADFTGWKIRSEKSISVITGTASSQVNVDETCHHGNAGFVFSPSTDQAGNQFVVPKIAKQAPGDSGAYIRVISFTQSNLIELPHQSIQAVLHSGQFYELRINPWDEITQVSCRDACIVMLFNEVMCESGEGNFLIYVTPIQHGTESVQFTAMEKTETPLYFNNFITIVADTEDITLDDIGIGGWRQIPDWSLYEVSISISHGEHTLQSLDGGKFVAFVYGHSRSWGYGTELVYGERQDLPGKIPSYRISLISDWVSEDIMYPTCVGQYSNQLMQKTVRMGMDINNIIGDTLCADLSSDDISVTSTSSQFIASDYNGNTFVRFMITPVGHVPFIDVLFCADEIIEYAKPHESWEEPLLDAIPDCANPVFEAGVFYDGLHEWMCLSNDIENEEYSTVPSTYIYLEDLVTTHDNSDLTPECNFRYGGSLDNKSFSMRSTINSLLGNQLCPGMNGISVTSHVSSFTAQGNTALVNIYFVLNYDSTMSGGEVLICSEYVMQFLSIYDNWDQPLLPPETGCPNILFDGQNFNEASHGWICNQRDEETLDSTHTFCRRIETDTFI